MVSFINCSPKTLFAVLNGELGKKLKRSALTSEKQLIHLHSNRLQLQSERPAGSDSQTPKTPTDFTRVTTMVPGVINFVKKFRLLKLLN